MHLIDAAHRGVDRSSVADIALHELDVALDAGKPSQRTS